MKYISTRSGYSGPLLSFEQAVFAGLAPDGGLYVPEAIPSIPEHLLSQWSAFSFQELAFEIFSLFIDAQEVPVDDLKELIRRSFASFAHPSVTPLRRLDSQKDIWLLELFHGPTLAFKDVALQFLGNLFEYFLQRRSMVESITVVGATSGDTGSYVIAIFFLMIERLFTD